MLCSKCRVENPVGKKFCTQCGTALAAICPKCGASNPVLSRFCGDCRAGLLADDGYAQPLDGQAASSAEGERRHLTVLFCDLVNSTAISSHLDPEEWHQLASRFESAAAQAVTRFGGHVSKFLGDGLMAYFGWPEAHEDDAVRAVRAGLAILETIAELNQQLNRNNEDKLLVRIGIDSGATVIARGGGAEHDVFGGPPTVASRVQAVAIPGAVFMTAATHQLLSGLFVVEDRGAQPLKGLEYPVHLYRVIEPAAIRRGMRRALTRFVGREEEIRLVLSRWERVRDGEGQVLLVVGEPGIGKSRLLEEFRQQIRENRHLWIESAGQQFFQNTPFHAVTQVLGQALGSRGDESTDERLRQLERWLDLAGMKVHEALPLVAEMLNLPVPDKYRPLMFAPDQRRKLLLTNLAMWMLKLAAIQPVVIALEDLHWLDPSTLELLQMLVEQNVTAPLMLLLTARSEFRPSWPMRAHHTQLNLNRLNNRQTREMVVGLASGAQFAAGMVDAVVERTDGIPLFAEELTRLMLGGGAHSAVREIPVTLQDSLTARLDRLGPAKEVAHLAAVLGREFSYELIHAVSALPESELQSALGRLMDADLIHVRGISPDASYQFKHALIQDAAYEALLKSRRKELHRRVAQAIAERFAPMAEAQPEVLARHWTEAGEAEPAIAAWKKAGGAADARRAFKEAEVGYGQALTMLRRLTESPERDTRELELISALADVLYVTKGYTAPEFIETTVRARELAEKSGNLAQLVHQVHGAWAAVQVSGDYRAAAVLADRVLDLAQREGSGAALGLAHMAQVATRYWRGDLVGVEDHIVRGKASFDAPGFKLVPGVAILTFSYSSLNAWTLGRADTARKRIGRAVEVAYENNSRYDLALAQNMAAELHLYLREPERAEHLAAESVALSDEHSFELYKWFSRICLGRAQAQLGNAAGGIALITEGLAGMAKVGEVGARRGISRYLTYLAEAQALDCATANAIKTVEEALHANSEELAYRAETLRVRGELRLKAGLTEMAEADFREAVALAAKMSAKAWELRATMSLARLLRDMGRRDDARAKLAGIYSWFTEGFDTADLKDASALLAEVS